jgi:PAS domain S-box-containing protein
MLPFTNSAGAGFLSALHARLRRPRETESERRYQQLIEASPTPINLFDTDGTIVWGNDAVLDLLNLPSRRKLIGRSIFEFVSSEDRTTAEQELRTVIIDQVATGPTSMQVCAADGELKTIRVATAPGRFNGRDIGQAVVIDETAIDDLHHVIDAERQFIGEALDTLHDVFYVLTIDGTLERWNRTLLDITGYTAQEVATMPVEAFFIEADHDRIADSVATAYAEGEATVEATVLTKTGRKIPAEFRKRRLNIDGEVVGIVGIGRDMTDRHARDQHLRAVDRLLQHALRNKTNLILGMADQLRDTGTNGGVAAVDTIDAAAGALLSMFDHHRHILRVLIDNVPPERVAAEPLLDEVVTTMSIRYPEATITHTVPADAAFQAVPAIDRATAELIENAIVHNDQDVPSVIITVDPGETSVVMTVADNGPRIPAIESQVIMGELPTSPTAHSQGLGLWFVNWVASSSGGLLTFEENTPAGNIVQLELPVAA